MERDTTWLLRDKYGGNADAPGFARDLERLAAGEPLAYVIGFQPFLGMKIYLDSRPLIPRPETEWWVEQLFASFLSSRHPVSPLEEGAQRDGASQSKFPAGNYAAPKAAKPGADPLLFLDLCAGSGAIGCAALARLPEAQVYFGEVDPAHEATIRKNIRENGLDESRAHIGIGDLFEPFPDMRFDVIAANPPYIPEGRPLEAGVERYEPALALRSGPDGLALMRRIAAHLPHRLAPAGIAWIECDSGHADAARDLFTGAGCAASVIPDQYGEPRVIAVSSTQ